MSCLVLSGVVLSCLVVISLRREKIYTIPTPPPPICSYNATSSKTYSFHFPVLEWEEGKKIVASSVSSCLALPDLVLYLVLSCLVLSCLVSCLVLSCLVSCLVLSYLVLSRLALFCSVFCFLSLIKEQKEMQQWAYGMSSSSKSSPA
jgi:hypothetical protein